MIGSRICGIVNIISRSPSNKKFISNTQQICHQSQWHYRQIPEPPMWSKVGANIVAVLAYWWLYWNLYHNWEHLIGFHNGKPPKDPRDYTDEELGIPPDDA